MADDPRAKLLKLLEALRELDEKRTAIYAEMDTLLAGGEGIGAKITRLKAHFQACWRDRYKSNYSFANHAMVGASYKRWLLKEGHTEADIEARHFAYMKSDDSFYTRARHPFEIFVKGFNSFVGLPAPVVDPLAEETTNRLKAARGE